VLQDHYDDERDKTIFHNTTRDLKGQDQFFLVSDQSCPKTDGLRPHILYAVWYVKDIVEIKRN